MTVWQENLGASALKGNCSLLIPREDGITTKGQNLLKRGDSPLMKKHLKRRCPK